ncbi:DUF6988 family protein [Cupriavidus sp. D39]|uniref:DUF6988 family protein n=1 Tax=Cupriavidus sp. D39 TaxID=2997877 RepID=UPI00226F4228|nr:hypothetical protein [Cupriavidus sp. D39]MCY0854357.1 hypothetical protein [Cupriavidus sp. D39]
MWKAGEHEAVDGECERLFALAAWLDDQGGSHVPSDPQSVLAAACLDQTLEHQKAVLLLTRACLHGAAHALGRGIYESFVRGMWLYRCASVVQVAAFEAQDQKTLPHLKDSSKFVADIGAALEGNAVPSKFRVDYWRILCDFAHTGPMQAKRRLGFEGSPAAMLQKR